MKKRRKKCIMYLFAEHAQVSGSAVTNGLRKMRQENAAGIFNKIITEGVFRC